MFWNLQRYDAFCRVLGRSDRARINVSHFGKYNTVFILHDTVFATYSENHDTKIKFYFVNQEAKIKLFLAVTIKIDFNMHMSFFYEKSFIVGVCARELSWHKILFSNINWSQFFFSFLLTLSLFGWELVYINTSIFIKITCRHFLESSMTHILLAFCRFSTKLVFLKIL